MTQFGGARTFGAGAGEGEYIVDITQENISEEVMNSEVPVILDCYADWCGPCRRLTPMLEEAVANAEGKLKVGVVVGAGWARGGDGGGFVLKGCLDEPATTCRSKHSHKVFPPHPHTYTHTHTHTHT